MQIVHAQLAKRRNYPRQGLGFLPQSLFSESGNYDSYFEPDLYYYGDFFDYGNGNSGGGSGIDWKGNTSIFDWNWNTGTSDWSFDGYGFYDPNSGAYVDPYFGSYDVNGNPFTLPDTVGSFDWINQPYLNDQGEWVLTNPTEPGGVNVDDIGQTLDWWNGLTSDNSTPAFEPVTLPDADIVDWDYVMQTFDYTQFPSVTLPRVYDPPPPKTAPKSDKTAWLKKMGEALAKSAASGASGGARPASSSAAKPPQTQPNAQGQCPNGYVKLTNGQCALISPNRPTAQAGDLWDTIKSNPLYWFLGGIGLILLAKK